jgi:hypothetical protein
MKEIVIRAPTREDAEGIITHIIDISSEPDIYVSYTPEEANIPVGPKSDRISQGIGTRLMKAAIDWAQDKRIVRLELEVYAENAAAIHLYEKFGFEVEGRKRRYAYQRDRYYDSLIMSRLFI